MTDSTPDLRKTWARVVAKAMEFCGFREEYHGVEDERLFLKQVGKLIEGSSEERASARPPRACLVGE